MNARQKSFPQSASYKLLLEGICLFACLSNSVSSQQLIESDWSKPINGVSVRVNADVKFKWGQKETPTFLLEAKNSSTESRSFTIERATSELMVDGSKFEYSLRQKNVISVEPGKSNHRFFLLQLSDDVWKHADKGKEGSTLSSLKVGKHELVFQLKDQKGNPRLSTGKIQFEITNNQIEIPPRRVFFVDADGKAYDKRLIYVVPSGQFTLRRSGHNGTTFERFFVGDFFESTTSGINRYRVEPVQTDKDGMLLLSPKPNEKHVVVITKDGNSQIFDIPKQPGKWNVEIKKGGTLEIERNIPSVKIGTKLQAMLSAVTPLGDPPEPNPRRRLGNTNFLRETMTFDIVNGKKVVVSSLRPGTYSLFASVIKKDGARQVRVSSISRRLTFEDGQTIKINQSYKTGQKVALSLDNVPKDLAYACVHIVPDDFELPSRIGMISNTIWSDAKFDPVNGMTFESHSIPPGKHQIIVVAGNTAALRDPNSAGYIGSKRITVGKSGLAMAGGIKLLPREKWLSQSGRAIQAKFVDHLGNPVARKQIWPLYKGFNPQGTITAMITDASGLANCFRSPGTHGYIYGAEQKPTSLFEFKVPIEGVQDAKLTTPPKWKTDLTVRPELDIVAGFDKSTNKLKIEVENKSDFDFSIDSSEFQLVIKCYDGYLGVRCLKDSKSTGKKVTLKANSKNTFVYEWQELLRSGYWCNTNVNNISESRNETGNPSVFEIGPGRSKTFYLPSMPTVKLK